MLLWVTRHCWEAVVNLTFWSVKHQKHYFEFQMDLAQTNHENLCIVRFTDKFRPMMKRLPMPSTYHTLVRWCVSHDTRKPVAAFADQLRSKKLKLRGCTQFHVCFKAFTHSQAANGRGVAQRERRTLGRVELQGLCRSPFGRALVIDQMGEMTIPPVWEMV